MRYRSVNTLGTFLRNRYLNRRSMTINRINVYAFSKIIVISNAKGSKRSHKEVKAIKMNDVVSNIQKYKLLFCFFHISMRRKNWA